MPETGVSIPIHPNDMYSDAAKLMAIARWFDRHDVSVGEKSNEVQTELRRIAKRVAQLDGHTLRSFDA